MQAVKKIFLIFFLTCFFKNLQLRDVVCKILYLCLQVFDLINIDVFFFFELWILLS